MIGNRSGESLPYHYQMSKYVIKVSSRIMILPHRRYDIFSSTWAASFAVILFNFISPVILSPNLVRSVRWSLQRFSGVGQCLSYPSKYPRIGSPIESLSEPCFLYLRQHRRSDIISQVLLQVPP